MQGTVGVVSGDEIECSDDIVTSPCMGQVLTKVDRRTATSHVDTKYADALADKTPRQTQHVGSRVATREPVQQQDRWIAGPPLRRPILMQQNGIAIRNLHAMPNWFQPRHLIGAKRYDGL